MQIQFSIGVTGEFNKSHVALSKDSDKVEDAILTIEHAQLSDRNLYHCSAKNKATESGKFKQAEDGAYIRVEGKFNIEFIHASLWWNQNLLKHRA